MANENRIISTLQNALPIATIDPDGEISELTARQLGGN